MLDYNNLEGDLEMGNWLLEWSDCDSLQCWEESVEIWILAEFWEELRNDKKVETTKADPEFVGKGGPSWEAETSSIGWTYGSYRAWK